MYLHVTIEIYHLDLFLFSFSSEERSTAEEMTLSENRRLARNRWSRQRRRRFRHQHRNILPIVSETTKTLHQLVKFQDESGVSPLIETSPKKIPQQSRQLQMTPSPKGNIKRVTAGSIREKTTTMSPTTSTFLPEKQLLANIRLDETAALLQNPIGEQQSRSKEEATFSGIFYFMLWGFSPTPFVCHTR